jgi:hypothetical protein
VSAGRVVCRGIVGARRRGRRRGASQRPMCDDRSGSGAFPLAGEVECPIGLLGPEGLADELVGCLVTCCPGRSVRSWSANPNPVRFLREQGIRQGRAVTACPDCIFGRRHSRAAGDGNGVGFALIHRKRTRPRSRCVESVTTMAHPVANRCHTARPLARYDPTGATPVSILIRENSLFPVTGRPVREGYPRGRRIAGHDVRPVRHPRTARAHRPR